MTDTSKLQYYTEYNAYKNLQVRAGSIAVDTTSVPAGSVGSWQTSVSVSDNSKFSTALIQNNRDNNPTVTALKYAAFPSANQVWQTLSTDPVGANTHNLQLQIKINNNQVTFIAQTFNPYGGALAFNAFSIGFLYAVHTTDI